MKILTAQQTRALDEYTIQNQPIASIDLMEKASLAFCDWFMKKFPDQSRPINILCGPGNNGGDGLAIARILKSEGYNPEVLLCKIGNGRSEDCQTNLERLLSDGEVEIQELAKDAPIPPLADNVLLIDALFGSGLNRAISGYWGEVIQNFEQQATTIVSVDIPSGVFADQHTSGISFHADYTFSFELPKLAFFQAENQDRIGQWAFGSIGLSQTYIEQTNSPFHYTTLEEVKSILKERKAFTHKGTFGHALLIGGSYGKVGAILLAAKAGLRAGAGLVTVHAPRCAYQILQLGFPEAMVSIDPHQFVFSKVPDLSVYRAIGIGCGLGTNEISAKALKTLLDKGKSLVLDADALNLISLNTAWLDLIPEGSILTPHPKEFERIFGTTPNHFDRLQVLKNQAKALNSIIILKGAYTVIASPDGQCYFNSTGNPGMGTGGTGDVLTGMITGLYAQGYTALEAAKLGVYLHGLAGDLAAQELEQEAILASDLIQNLGKAFKVIRQSGN